MAELSTFARPYAEALFRIARDGGDGRLTEWSTRLREMAVVAAHPDMRAVAADPMVSAQQLFEIFTSALSSELSAEANNLVHTLIDNDRLSVLPAIARQFDELKNAHEGAADAEIVSAFPLDDAQLKELVAVLERKFGVRLKPTVRVDESLIGGVRVTVGDRTLDSSVRAQLDRMQVALTA
jgi:F-type H+-transporting ATPase subunit delta